jgi:hypothetical protein
MIEEGDWTDPVRLEARVAAVVERNRPRLADPVQAPAAFQRLAEELARSLGAAGIPDARAVACGLLLQAVDQAGIDPPGRSEGLAGRGAVRPRDCLPPRHNDAAPRSTKTQGGSRWNHKGGRDGASHLANHARPLHP